MRTKKLRGITLLGILANLGLILLLALPRRADRDLIPAMALLEGRRYKAETSGGKEQVEEVGFVVTHLLVKDQLVWLYGDDELPSIWDWEIDPKQGCLLSHNGGPPQLRLEDHHSYLSITGLSRKTQIYFVEMAHQP